MRVCESCGRENVDRNKFCVWCGKSFLTDEAVVETAVQEAAPFEEVVTVEENLPAEGYAAEEETADPVEYPMKWHKFLMVTLIIGGLWRIGQGLTVLTGTWYEIYDVNMEGVLRYFPELKTLTWGLGVVTLALGVFTFTVRKRLKNFMKSGPRSLQVLYGASIGTTVLYLLGAMAVLGFPVMSIVDGSRILVDVVGSLCIMYAQKKYYDKRKELFINS